jgi:hypothetical protein
MTPLEKCIEALAVLARTDDPIRLVLMEGAIDSFAKDSRADDEARYGALDDLAHTVAGQGWDMEFTTLIMEYIAKQRDRRAMKD